MLFKSKEERRRIKEEKKSIKEEEERLLSLLEDLNIQQERLIRAAVENRDHYLSMLKTNGADIAQVQNELYGLRYSKR